MNRFGKGFKNRFLAMTLAGAMVITSVASSEMPVFAAQTTDVESAEDGSSWDETKDVSEEAAEDEEVKQRDSEENETEQQESKKTEAESGTTSKKESTTAKEEVATEDLETDSEDAEESQTDVVDNKATVIYTSDSAALAEGHKNAKWETNGTLLNSDDTPAVDGSNKPALQSGKKGIYKNGVGDILYIDTAGSNGNGKFAPSSDKIQIRNTKIYVPVITDNAGKAKITIYQSSNTISSKDDVFNSEKNVYFKLLKNEAEISSEMVECTLSTTNSIEMVITLNDSQDTSAVICVEVVSKTNNDNFYATKIISGKEVNDDIYDEDTGNSKDLVKYNMEGYANAYGVSGGGMLKDTASSYYKVSNAVGFLEALTKVKEAGKPAVIEVTGDLNLGSKELGKDANNKDNLSKYSSIIGADKFQALWHPTLKTSGVSDLTLEGFNDLTIFSSNDKGSAIKHCNIIVKKSTNIIFRNFSFDELWEWDDGGTVEAEKATYVRGGYKRNDWDYLCIDSESDGIWIDHCTFYKSYDGLIDIKNPKTNGEERVTISWCKFEPKSAPSENGTHPFFDEQLDALEKDYQSGDPKAIYYKSLRTTEAFDYTYTKYSNKVGTQTTETFKGEGYSLDDIVIYTCGQKKAHLLGQGDDVENAVGIRVTFANNSWVNCMDRLPRLRRGIAHEYNCVLDASELYNAKNAGSKAKSHLVSNGAISTVDGSVFLENCYIDGIDKPLLSGNSGSNRGYIGFEDCIYKHGEDRLEVICNTTDNTDKGKDPLTLTKAQFKEKLPASYGSYQLYAADDLKTKVLPYAGAGSVKMSAIQWTKTSYGDGTSGGGDDDDNPPTDPKNPPAGYGDSLILNANDLEVEEITKTIKLNNHYTIIGASDGAVTIKGITQTTINEKTFTKAIGLSGSGSDAKSAIAVAAPKAGKLIVYSTGAPVLKTGSEEPQNGNSTETGITEYTIGVAGTYYLCSSGSGSDVYYIEFSEQTQEPSGDEKTETLKFRVDQETTGSLTKDLKVNDYFTIKAISGNGNEIKSVSKTTIGEESFTKYVKLNGTASTDDKSIKIYALGGGTLTIYASSSSASAGRTVNLLDSEGKVVSGQSHNGVTTATSFTLEIPEKGIYYVGSKSSGLFIYGIDFEVTYIEGEELPRDPSDADFPQYTAPEGDSVYDASEGNEQSKVVYNMEGYAASANVTGGGLLKEEDSQYYIKATDEEEFLKALEQVRNEGGKPHVIEITKDLNLGTLDLKKNFGLNIVPKGDTSGTGNYTGVIRAFAVQPTMHPTLKDTGASYIRMNGFKNLTIFSKNGATIKHAGIVIDGTSQNIIIRNLTFDELWEWDDKQNDKGQYGSYDKNDWDYISIEEKSEGIWIDHCTFYKAYDGVLDIKQGQTYQRVTISWCEFLPGSKNNTFFNAQMKELEKDIENTEYYKQLRQTMSKEDVWWYAYGQKKTHLFGDDDKNAENVAIRATLANNYYKNSMDRMPRLRYGKAHEYNCILDAQNLNTQKKAGNSHITSQGALSTCNGELLLENCYIRGIDDPLISGNGGAPGYINAVGSVYYMNKSLTELTIRNKAGSGYSALPALDAEQFKDALPYSDYITRDATKLYSEVVPYAGAGKVSMSVVQWERTNYGDITDDMSSSTSTAPNDEPAGPNDEPPKMPSWDDPENPDDENSGGTEEGSSGTEEGSSGTEEGSSGTEEGSSGTEEGSSGTEEGSETDESENELGRGICITGLSKEPYQYTGAKIIPDIEVRDYDRNGIKGEVLAPGVDYTVKYSNNTKPTTKDNPAVIIVTGKGNYKGAQVKGEFQISDASNIAEGVTPVSVKGAKIEILADSTDLVYTGKAKYPNFKFTLKGGEPVEYKYNEEKHIYETADAAQTPIPASVAVSNNVNKGTATILITGAEEKNKPTTVKKTFKITAVDLSKATDQEIKITPSNDAEYAVKGAVPGILTVTYKEQTLKIGKDFTVKYTNNKKAGSPGTVTITGKGNYAKKRAQTYTIQKLDLSKTSVKAVTAYDGVQVKKIKATVVDGNGTALKPSQYTLKFYHVVETEGEKTVGGEYLDTDILEENVKSIYVKAEANDSVNLEANKATELAEFSVGKDIAKAKVALVKDSNGKAITKEYTGNKVELEDKELIVTMKDVTKPLEPGTDYTVVSCENNINKGTATAVIKGVGTYSGTKTVKFKIVQREMVPGVPGKEAVNGIKALNDFLNGTLK